MNPFSSLWLAGWERRQTPAARQAEPVDGEAEARERDLHDKIEDECASRGWMTVRSRMDRKTTTRKGVCDFIIYADDGRMFHVEAKSSTGKLSTDQRDFKAWAEKLGHKVEVVSCMREFLRVIEGKN